MIAVFVDTGGFWTAELSLFRHFEHACRESKGLPVQISIYTVLGGPSGTICQISTNSMMEHSSYKETRAAALSAFVDHNSKDNLSNRRVS